MSTSFISMEDVTVLFQFFLLHQYKLSISSKQITLFLLKFRNITIDKVFLEIFWSTPALPKLEICGICACIYCHFTIPNSNNRLCNTAPFWNVCIGKSLRNEVDRLAYPSPSRYCNFQLSPLGSSWRLKALSIWSLGLLLNQVLASKLLTGLKKLTNSTYQIKFSSGRMTVKDP